jgi:hypothetical protein
MGKLSAYRLEDYDFQSSVSSEDLGCWPGPEKGVPVAKVGLGPPIIIEPPPMGP